MATRVSYPAVFEYVDSIGLLNGRSTMSNHHGRAPLHQLLQSDLNVAFRFGIERCLRIGQLRAMIASLGMVSS